MTTTERKIAYNNFMMDFENWCLERWDARQGIPTGPLRYKDEAWAAHMKKHIENSDVKGFEAYAAWVSEGNGDEWFVDDELNKSCPQKNDE